MTRGVPLRMTTAIEDRSLPGALSAYIRPGQQDNPIIE